MSVSRPFFAKYDGFCAECGDDITADMDEIQMTDDGPKHVGCVTESWRPTSLMDAAAKAPKQPAVCDRCHLTKPCDCD